jgi:thiol:disulfide interchange protein DsbC
MKKILLALSLFVFAAAALAGKEEIISRLKEVSPDLPISDVVESPIKGVYEVQLNNGESLYASPEGGYFLLGQMFAVQNGSFVNLSEQRLNAIRKELLATVRPEDTIQFPAKGEEKAVIHIFTDVDCGYCRKLHNEINQINELGITVRYLAYPRSGMTSPTARKLETAWCSKDRALVLTQYKRDEDVDLISCPTNLISQQYALGGKMGVTGTPAIVTSEGRLIPGYLPARRLARELGI